MKKIPNKFDIFLYFIVILTVMSSFVSIYTLYQQGGFELLIIDKVIQMVFVISMYAYYRKGNIIMLLFMALSLVGHIMFVVELYSWYVSQQRHLARVFEIIIYMGVFIYFLYTALKKRM